jgi:hypothetical protein
MAITPASPMSAPGLKVGGADRLELFQTVFSGMVLDAAMKKTVLDGWTYTRPCQGKKAESFPLVGDATAGYHAAAGDEVVAQTIEHNERIVNLDRPLVSAVRIDDWEDLVNHFELYGRYATKLGNAIAALSDKHKMYQIYSSARGELKGGTALANIPSGLYDTGTTVVNTNLAGAKDDTNVGARANALAYSIMEVEQGMAEKEVDVATPKLGIVKPTDYFAMHQAAIDKTCPWLNIDYKGKNTYGEYARLMVGNTEIKMSNEWKAIAGTDQASSGAFAKYYGNLTDVEALVTCDEAVASLSGMNMQIEKGRDFIHQNDMVIARMAEGHETFRPECAGVIRSAVEV